MVPTAIPWIALAISALALLIVIGLLAHRVNRASTVFVGYIATDRDGEVFLYGLRPSRNHETGAWMPVDCDEPPIFIPENMRTAMNPPKWDEEPRFVELWMTSSPEPSPFDVQEDDDIF